MLLCVVFRAKTDRRKLMREKQGEQEIEQVRNYTRALIPSKSRFLQISWKGRRRTGYSTVIGTESFHTVRLSRLSFLWNAYFDISLPPMKKVSLLLYTENIRVNLRCFTLFYIRSSCWTIICLKFRLHGLTKHFPRNGNGIFLLFRTRSNKHPSKKIKDIVENTPQCHRRDRYPEQLSSTIYT